MNRTNASLRFYCPSCEEQMGICRCDRMGSSHNGQGWYYDIFPETTSRWRLDPESVLEQSQTRANGVHRFTSQRLNAFTAWLQHRPS